MSRPKDIRHYYYYLNEDYIPSLNQQINQTNKIIRENGLFEVVDLHSIFLDEEGELNLKFSDDGLHLNEVGYEHWMNKIKQLVDEINK